MPAPADAASRADVSFIDIQDELDRRYPDQRLQDNLAALETILKLRDENRAATPEEQNILMRWSGMGDKDVGFLFVKPEQVSWNVSRSRRPYWDRFQAIAAKLTPDELQTLRESYLNANYTSKAVVDAMWSAVKHLGVGDLKRIKMIEPAGGVGRFLGLQPTDMVAKSERHTVEMESLSADIMKQLFPRTRVVNKRLEETNLPDNYYDLAISNVPFSEIKVVDPDPKYRSQKYSFLTRNLHNYYFAKTLDKVRPGGLIAYITSTSSMDSQGALWRKYMADNADLLGAYRLPKSTFSDTGVMTDILIFRKRYPNDPPGDQSWIDTKKYKVDGGVIREATDRENKDTFVLNGYWAKNRQNMLGRIQFSTYRGGSFELVGDLGAQFGEQLQKRLLETLPQGLIGPEEYAGDQRVSVDPDTQVVPDGTHLVDPEGKVWVQRSGKMVKLDTVVATTADRIKRMLVMHDAAKIVSDIQNGKSSADLKTAQDKLGALYWDFLKKYGPLHAEKKSANGRLIEKEPNSRIFTEDPGWGLVSAVENWDETAQKAYARGELSFNDKNFAKVKKVLFSDFLTKELLNKPGATSVEGDPAAALILSLGEKGRIDWNHMAQNAKMTSEAMIAKLGDAIYQNPQGDWEPSDEYLSGDVKSKLEAARYYAKREPEKYSRNVEALAAVQPTPISWDTIFNGNASDETKTTKNPGAIYVPDTVLDHFFYDVAQREPKPNAAGGIDWVPNQVNVENLRTRVPRHRYVAGAGIRAFNTDNIYENPAAADEYAVTRHNDPSMNASIADLWNDVLHDKPTRLGTYTTDAKGNSVFVLDEARTKRAEDQKLRLRQEFQTFISQHPEYQSLIEATYNDMFNRYKAADFQNGWNILKYPGKVADTIFKMRPHQSAAVWRIIRTGRAGLFHEAGFGKTATMIAAGMEARRLGLVRRNLYVVPKNIVGQWGEHFRRLYPTAKVLVPGEDDFKPANRANFLNRIKTNDTDAIIVSYEQFQRMQSSPETLQEYYTNEVRKFEDVLDTVKTTGSGDRFTQRALESRLKSLRAKLKDAVQKSQERRPGDVFWEDLGIDQLFVDEAHNFKNLGYATTKDRIKGMPNTDAGRSTDLYIKTQELMRRRGGKGVILATGTPMSNTLAENWTMQRYLQPDLLEDRGLENFDAWSSTFGQIAPDWEQQADGNLKETNRFRYFDQVPELSRLWQLTGDIRTSRDDPNLKAMAADLRGGNRIQMSAPSSAALRAFKEGSITPRLNRPQRRGPSNPFKVQHDARNAALDMRLVDDLYGTIPGVERGSQLPEDPRSKINLAAQTIWNNYQEFSDPKLVFPEWAPEDVRGKPGLGTQLVFLDLSTPKAEELKPADTGPVQPTDAPATNTDEAPPADDTTTAEEAEFQDSVYGVLRDKLVAQGIPADEIAFAHQYKDKPEKRQQLYKMVNDGKIRVVISSRALMSEGVNIQKRLGAIHHIDAPWTPARLEQGEKRGLRQGNDLFGPGGTFDKDGVFKRTNDGIGVRIYQYLTEDSFDGVMWQAVETKAKSMMEMMSRNPVARSIVDVDPFVLDAAAARASVAKEPLVLMQKQFADELRKRQGQVSSAEEVQRQSAASLPRLQRDLAENKRQQAAAAKDAELAKKGVGVFDFQDTTRKKIDPKGLADLLQKKVDAIRETLKKRPGIDIPEGLKETRIGKFNGFDVDLVLTQARPFGTANRFDSKTGTYVESQAWSLRLKNADKGSESYETNPVVTDDTDTSTQNALARADWATRLDNVLKDQIGKRLAAAQREQKNLETNIQAASYAQTQGDALKKQRQTVGQMRALTDRITAHLSGAARFTDEQAQQAQTLIAQFRKGESPSIDPKLLAMPPTAVLDKLKTALIYQGSLHTTGTVKDIVQRWRTGQLTEDFLRNTPLQTDAGALTPDEIQTAITYLNSQKLPEIGGASPGGYAGRFDPNAPIGPDNQPPAAGFNPLGAIKAHPRLTTAAILGGLTYAGMNEAQQEQQQKGKVDELTNIPLVNHVLDAGSSTVNLGDIVRGLNEYNSNVLPVTAELVARVAEVPVSAIARGLGANASNVDTSTSFFDVLQPQAMQGINLSAPNETIKALQDSWATRQQHNPTLAFLTSLPADPLNWLGWEEGKVSASEFEKAAQPFLKPEVITAQDYEKAVNPINQASGHWWSQISRAAQSRRIANEFGMAALREGSRDSAPVETLERIDKAMKTNSATLDQARLAHLWGQSRPVDSAAVMDLQRAFGIATPTSPDADVVRAIAARVKGKTKWNADDLTWLDRQFGYSSKAGGAAGRKLASINRVQQWAAVHGTPDLSAAIEAVETMTPREFAQSTVYKARAAFPARQSPLSAWMETANPVSHALFAMYKQAEPGLSKFNRAVNLPIILSYLMSPGWTLHAAVENTLRSYRGSLKGFGRFLGGKVDPTPWYHDMDMARSVLGHYYGIDILEGRGGFASAPFEENVLSNSKFPLIGGAGNKWAADVIRAPIRNPMGGVDAAQASRFKQIQDLRAAAKKAGTAPDTARIKALLSSKPTDAMALALNGFATVVEKSNLSTLYGLNQYLVGKVEGAARTYWIAGEHAKVYDQVLKMMAPEVQAADAQLRDVLHKPAGLDDAVWNRIVGATKNVLHKPGALTDVVEKEIRGTIDRLNLAKSIFLEKDIPYPVQAELYMAMRHGTPEELQRIFGKGGFADQALEGGLTFMQGNRIQPMIDAIMRRPDLNLSTVAGQKQAWAMLDNALEAGITQHRDLWTWARAMTPTMSETEKAALYAEVRKINQNWLGLQRIEQANARRMFENAIRSKQGFATVPDEVLNLQDRAVQEAMATYEKSDALIQSYWADVITNGRENPALWKQMQQEREQVWNEYRASRNEIEARKTKAMEDFYAKNQGNPSQVGLLPTAGESEVSQASRDAANAALDRVRANVGDFTMRPTISGQQADALRAWVRDVNDKIALLPERVTNAIDDANQRTARIVQDRMRSHFVDHLNTSEVAEFARNFIPFWMYDSSGGAYYLWLAQHMPGVYSTADRLETMSGGTGYLTGGMNPVSMPNSPLNAVLPAADFGVFGNKVSPARGLWPARLLTFQNLLERNVGQVKSLQDFFNLEMQNMRTQGILGMHASPLLEAGGLLAAGQYPNLPPPLTMATDISGATGNNFNLPLVGDLRANDQFLNYNIKMELAGKGIDPASATPQQLQDAERAVAIRDAADSLVPRFTYTSPEKLQQQKDFQDALAGLGYSKKDQADMIAQGFSPWSVLDSQQKKQLMLAHPDWAYQFEAADAFKTPEEQKAADATRKWLKANAQISSDRLAQQTANDTKLKTDPTKFTPQMWMKEHTKLANITAGRRQQNNLDNSTGQSAFAQQMLNKVRTPQDKAVSDYYTWYSDEIKKNTTGDTIDWGTVNQARKQYLAQLPPLVQQYVTQEITQNETDVEKQFYAALDQLDQYNAIPRWIGVPPAVAAERSKEEQEYARIRQVKPASATAYRLMHPLLARRLPRNPMRDQFLAKNLLLAMWFVPIDAKKMPVASAELNQMYFGEPVSADWLTNGSGTPEGNSSVAPAPVQPPQPAPGLAAG